MNTKPGTIQNKRLAGILLTATALLLLPFIAMQFTREVNWSLSDFVIAGILLFGTGLAIELVLRKVKQPKHRILFCGIILLAISCMGRIGRGHIRHPICRQLMHKRGILTKNKTPRKLRGVLITSLAD